MKGEQNLCTLDERQRFELECVARHNQLRKFHNADPLKRSRTLSKEAQLHAEELLNRRNCGGRGNGHTVCHIINRSVCATEITDMWYAESSRVNFSNLVLDDLTARFTQLVWKDTREMGVGLARDKNDHVFVVAVYHPPGNVPHLAKDNLCPPVVT